MANTKNNSLFDRKLRASFLVISKCVNASCTSEVPDFHGCITAGSCQLRATDIYNKQLKQLRIQWQK